MSIVIAAKTNEGILMGADALTSHGKYEKVTSLGESNLKITKMPHGILLGHTGSVRVVQILSCHKDWFEQLGEEPLSKKFLVTQIVPRFYRELKARDLLKEDDIANSFDGSFIVAQGDRLFALAKDFSVDEIHSFVSIGCGLDAAYMVRLKYGSDHVFDTETMLEALRLSAEVDNAIGAPFVLINTKEREYNYEEE